MRKPTNYEVQQGCQSIAVVACGLMALFSEDRRLALLNALAVGVNLAGVFYNFMLERMHVLVRQMGAANRQMGDLVQSVLFSRSTTLDQTPLAPDEHRTLN